MTNYVTASCLDWVSPGSWNLTQKHTERKNCGLPSPSTLGIGFLTSEWQQNIYYVAVMGF